MELFKTGMKDNDFIYVLDGINEEFGIMDLHSDHTLVALFQPVNCVKPLKLDGKLKAKDIQEKFGLSAEQGEAFAEILNHHIPNNTAEQKSFYS